MRPLGLMLALVLGITGCEKASVKREPSPDPVLETPATFRQACSLLRKSEVEAAVGEKLAGPRDPSAGGSLPAISVVGMRFCEFSSRKPAGPVVQVGLVTTFAREAFEKYKNSSPTKSALRGLGEEAMQSEFGASHTLVVLEKAKAVGINLVFVNQEPQETAEHLARVALSRL